MEKEAPFQPPSLELWPADLMHLIQSSPQNPESIKDLVDAWKEKQTRFLCETSKSPTVRKLAQKIIENFPKLNILDHVVETLPKGNELWKDFESFCMGADIYEGDSISLDEKMDQYIYFLESRYS